MRLTVQARDQKFVLGFPHGMTLNGILQTLKEYGRRGILTYEDGALAVLAQTVSDGETWYLLEEPEETPWFSTHAQMPSPSALANSVQIMKKYLGNEDPVYDLGRTSGTAAPLALIVDSFGLYVSSSKSSVLDSKDWVFVRNMMSMSEFYDDESLRQTELVRFLQAYLLSSLPNFCFKVSSAKLGRKEPDISIEVLSPSGEWILVTIVEVKPEMGLGGEPCIEAMKYFADHVVIMQKKRHWSFMSSCCPVLIIEAVGSTIRVGGAAFLEKPCHQPFTPYLHILRFLPDQDHWETLSRALGSIRVAIASLAEFYLNLQVESLGKDITDRVGSINWPLFIRNEERSNHAKVIQYERQLTRSALQVLNIGRQKQLVFHLRYPDGKQRIVKFCQRYGDKVHALWAEKGYAPAFHHGVLQGGWLVINMEYYAEEDGWRPLIALDPRLLAIGDTQANKYRLNGNEWEKCKFDVRKAYEEVYALNPLFVHGDMRRQNILYNVVTFKVAFIDFDWAGTDGEDRYPLFINLLNTWPPGVNCREVMRSEHDAKLLDIELG